ncbi:hypothetical protein niasHT_026999 [Heterodera trifolii]|uniref:BTB domain-containing protein n=1 Tax=Heterodera trifolii TaxID=157864 RepID=A0ABD2JIS1_9BILA
MPKIKSKSANFREWIRRIGGTDFYSTTGKIIYCQLCEQQVTAATPVRQQQQPKNSQISCTQFAHLKQHNETGKHKAKLERNKGGQQQQFLTTTTTNNIPNQFNLDLCEAFVAANIPFQKLESEKFKNFLEKYCKREIPHRSTLQKNYLSLTFDQTMERIKNVIGDSYVWISVDETTDKMGRAVANLLIGKLDGQKWHKPHLISVKCLEKVDSAAIARFVNEGLAYMKKAGKQLKVFYINLIHTMCLCHALHRVAEKVRDEFKKADKLIAKTKAVFVKAPQRSKIYHQMFPDLAMPPKAVLTRWGTWLQAVSFYWQNFEAVKEVVNSFDPSDASCVSESQSCFNQPTWQDLAYIHTNFRNLCPAIAKLESQGLSINESMEIFADVHNQLDKAAGEKAEIIRQKISYIVSKNPSFDQIAKFCQILSGKNVDCDVLPTLIPFYKFASLTSCDVERTFSIYKTILSDNRISLLPQNLEMPYSLSERMKLLLNNGNYADVHFLVGEGNAKELLPAHKLILITASNVFEAMFRFEAKKAKKDENAEVIGPVEITDIDADVFKAILSFIYADDLGGVSVDNAMEVFYAAKKYNIPGLINAISNCDLSKLSNVFLAFAMANFLGEEAIRWADEQCRQNLIECSPENRRAMLGPALSKIRFSLIQQEDFYKFIVPSGVLTNDELFIVKEYLHGNRSVFVQYPQRFPTHQRHPYKPKGMFLMKIGNSSEFGQNGGRQSSEIVHIRGVPWKILAVKEGDFLLFYMQCDAENIGRRQKYPFWITLRIICQKEGKLDHVIDKNRCAIPFYQRRDFIGVVSFSELMSPDKGWYDSGEDTVKVTVEVTIGEPFEDN